MSLGIAIVAIIYSISGLVKPEMMVNMKNQNLIKKGLPPISEEDRPKQIRKSRMFSIFILVLGVLILLLGILEARV